MLILELMHFADELLESASLQPPPKVSASKAEMEMAQALISKMTDKWDPRRYTDDYKSALLKLIETKAESGGRTPPMPKRSTKKESKVIDLVAVLKQSLAETASSKGGKTKTRAKAA